MVEKLRKNGRILVCSISGFVSSRGATKTDWDSFHRIMVRATERGRDSFGIVTDMPRIEHKFTGTILDRAYDFHGYPPARVVVNNNRAEPTTEYVSDKRPADIQPFIDDKIIVAHNGTIANDRELKAEHGLVTSSEIDSAVIAPLVRKYGVERALELLEGSYALAIWDGSLLWLACNYKPLYVKLNNNTTLFFSSLDAYLREGYWDAIRQLPPYSLTRVDPVWPAKMKTTKLLPEIDSFKAKVLVICSGGLDSTVVASMYAQSSAAKVTLLHFAYGCRAEDKEIAAVQAIADHLDCDVAFMEMHSIFRDVIGHSRLTGTHEELMTERKGERSAELAYEWVPARNLVFYSLALAYAEAHGYDVIALGNNLEESGAYPDNEMIFSDKFNDLIPHAVNLNNQVRIEMPVGHLMKHEIVAKGMAAKAPLHLTWSCYENGDQHCGTCGPCYMRKKAFSMNGFNEVISYAS